MRKPVDKWHRIKWRHYKVNEITHSAQLARRRKEKEVFKGENTGNAPMFNVQFTLSDGFSFLFCSNPLADEFVISFLARFGTIL